MKKSIGLFILGAMVTASFLGSYSQDGWWGVIALLICIILVFPITILIIWLME